MYSLKLKVNHINNEFLTEKYKQSNQYDSDIGIDLYIPEDIIINSKSTTLIDLGIQIEIINNINSNNVGFLLVPRSSIYKIPIRLANSIGVIDPNYRGNIKAAVDNISNEEIILKKGERYFQIIFTEFYKPNIIITDTLSKTDRNDNGFGSTNTL